MDIAPSVQSMRLAAKSAEQIAALMKNGTPDVDAIVGAAGTATKEMQIGRDGFIRAFGDYGDDGIQDLIEGLGKHQRRMGWVHGSLSPQLDLPVGQRSIALEDAEKYMDVASAATRDAKKAADWLERFRTPLRDAAVDVTAKAEHGDLHPIVARDAELDKLQDIISQLDNSNPLIVGEEGSGRGALVDGLALRIKDGQAPDLADTRLLKLNYSAMRKNASRGEGTPMEEQIKGIIQEAHTDPRRTVIVVEDLFGFAKRVGPENMDELLAGTSSGKVHVVGSIRKSEIEKLEEVVPLDRMTRMEVEPPSADETTQMLRMMKPKYEAHHGVEYTDKALVSAANFAERYITDDQMPRKAITLLDRATSRAVTEARVSGKVKDGEIVSVTDLDVAKIIEKDRGIPMAQLTQDQNEIFQTLGGKLKKQVMGADAAIDTLTEAFIKSAGGMKNPKKPIGTFILPGPSGSGKTELARALARELFGSEDAVVRVDLSEYKEASKVNNLIGSAKGYVGSTDGGDLTNAARKRPFGVLLLDEIDKAHPDVYDILLQLIDDGRLTDSLGTVKFNNMVIMATANWAAKDMLEWQSKFPKHAIPDAERISHLDEIKAKIIDDGNGGGFRRPEILGRWDGVLPMWASDTDSLAKITDIKINAKKKLLAESKQKELVWDDSVSAKIATEAFDPKFGARPAEKMVETEIANPIAHLNVYGNLDEYKRPTMFDFTEADNKITVSIRKDGGA